MDRRYRESRFYSGVPASRRGELERERIVRSALAKARRAANAVQSFGGSTGGASSAGGLSAGQVSAQRSLDANRWREIAKTYGSGALGASALGGRANLAELRGYRSSSETSDQEPPSKISGFSPSALERTL